MYIMANVAVNPPYALNAIVVSDVYYKIELGYWFNLVLVLSTQLTGFGLAGLCRRFLVWPASMVWPQNLVACTLLNTLHAEDEDESGGITRYRFFMWVTGGSFVFFFLPGTLLPLDLIAATLLTSGLSLLRLSVPSAVDFLVRLLDLAQQCPRESAVWSQQWPGYERVDV